MKILVAHNHYQLLSGEDTVFDAECSMLRQNGHEVIRYTVDNEAFNRLGKVQSAAKTLWNRETYREVSQLVRQEKPDVVHFHNTFPLMSPSVYYAVRREGVPVVQTLHNYRLLCPGVVFLREGRLCLDCMGKRIPWPGLVHKCYRDSLSASAVVVSQLTLHRMRGTWTHQVNAFITLSEFARERFIEGGLPAVRLYVKPHFIDPDPGLGQFSGDYALYVGRLGKEKGTGTLMKAWEIIGDRVPLIVVGEGPDQPLVEAAAQKNPRIQFLGKVERSKAIELMRSARYNLMPSDCWEMFGMSMLEAKAVGLPTIASNHGSFPSLIEEGKTGLLFEPMNADDLAAKVLVAVEHPADWEAMRERCRSDYLEHYTAETNYKQLIDIYRSAIESNTA